MRRSPSPIGCWEPEDEVDVKAKLERSILVMNQTKPDTVGRFMVDVPGDVKVAAAAWMVEEVMLAG